MTGAGLRRFVGPAPEPPPADTAVEACELCGRPAGEQHGHVVDLSTRSLKCACRPCYLLFSRPDAGGRFTAVPERYAYDPDHPISRAEWDALSIPVGSVFFLSSESGTHAFYPSPAGATECQLDLAAFTELARDHPLLAAPRPDVEAALVRCEGEGAVEAFLVPIDVCYELVGTVRLLWRGFDGGEEARTAIEAHYARLRSLARPLLAG
jgi:Family of unknown function (DUF5947)